MAEEQADPSKKTKPLTYAGTSLIKFTIYHSSNFIGTPTRFKDSKDLFW
jgi:hypothetical protein